MLDNTSIPQSLADSQSNVNPYQITDKIWNLIEQYFTEKYNVELKEAYPSKEVTRPTIVSLIQKRTPGRENSKIHGKGYNFAKFLKRSPDGYIHEVHVQQQEIIIEYSIYANSTAEVQDIAWDLERAVLETVGILQTEIEGFQLVFDQQTQDSSMLFRQQDELIRRTIRFKALLPVQFTKVVPELRFIEIIDTWGAVSVSGTVFTRTTSDKLFRIPVPTGKYVTAIRNVYVKETDYPYAWITLIGGTDFSVKRDRNDLIFLEWNDDYGKTPAVGQVFRIDYDYGQLVRGSTVRPQ